MFYVELFKTSNLAISSSNWPQPGRTIEYQKRKMPALPSAIIMPWSYILQNNTISANAYQTGVETETLNRWLVLVYNVCQSSFFFRRWGTHPTGTKRSSYVPTDKSGGDSPNWSRRQTVLNLLDRSVNPSRLIVGVMKSILTRHYG